jgi:hypothetical protein
MIKELDKRSNGIRAQSKWRKRFVLYREFYCETTGKFVRAFCQIVESRYSRHMRKRLYRVIGAKAEVVENSVETEAGGERIFRHRTSTD